MPRSSKIASGWTRCLVAGGFRFSGACFLEYDLSNRHNQRLAQRHQTHAIVVGQNIGLAVSDKEADLRYDRRRRF
jgi:hypothetical protein